MRKYLLVLLLSCFLLPSNATLIKGPLKDSLSLEQKNLIRGAFDEFKELPAAERKARLKKAKKEIRAFRAAKRKGMESDVNLLVLVVLAILLPPVAVYLYDQETTTRFWITLLLFLLGIAGALFLSWLLIFAAVVYALLIVLGMA